jgi:hypothetical protein
MLPRRYRFPILLVFVLCACTLVQAITPPPAYGDNPVAEEVVAFNTKSLKYHCLQREWAKKCTVNCVNVTRSEAIRRGGVPCKVCGGSC